MDAVILVKCVGNVVFSVALVSNFSPHTISIQVRHPLPPPPPWHPFLIIAIREGMYSM